MKQSNVDSRIVHRGRYLKVRVDKVRTGSRVSTYDLIEHPGAVAILAVTKEGRVILENQYRHALGQSILEIPAGTLEPGESPEECAKREMAEETGYRIDSMRKLGAVYTAPGYSNEIIHLFYAKVSIEVNGATPEPDETISLSLCTPEEVSELVSSGRLSDSKSLSALFIAERLGLVQL